MNSPVARIFLGIDIGTTNVKALLLTSAGTIAAQFCSTRKIAYSDKHPDHPDNVWAAFLQALDGIKNLRGDLVHELSSLAISGVAPNVCLMTEDGVMQDPLLRYSDGRARHIERDLDTRLSNGEWQNEILSKLVWLRKYTERAAPGPFRLYSPHTWLAWHLTGNYVMDYATAVEHGCVYDRANATWDMSLLAEHDITDLALPSTSSPFYAAGQLKADMAHSIGLSREVRVAVGAPDFLASMLGAGLRNVGDTLVYLGTYHCVSELGLSPHDLNRGLLHAPPVRWAASVPAAGPQCQLAAELVTGAAGTAAWAALDRLALDGPPDSPLDSEAIFLPCLQLLNSTIATRPASALILTGPEASRVRLARAVFLGVAIAISLDLERRQASIGPGPLYVSGGGARSVAQRQALSDVLQREVTFVESSEGGLGTALLAAAAASSSAATPLDSSISLPRYSTMPGRPVPPGIIRLYRRALNAQLVDA